MVYIVLFLFVTFGNVLVNNLGWDVPEYELAGVDRKVWNAFAAVEENDFVVCIFGMSAPNFGDVQRQHDVMYYYLTQMAKARVLVIPTNAEGVFYANQMIKWVWGMDDYQNHPLYGVQFAFGTMLPGGDYLGMARSIRKRWTADNFGNEWDDLPMMFEEDGTPVDNFHQVKLLVYGPYGMSVLAPMHEEFPEPLQVCGSNTNSQAYQGVLYSAGIAVDGHALGAKGAHAFEISANIPRERRIAKIVAVPQMMIAFTSLLGIVVCNYVYFTSERGVDLSGRQFRRPEDQ
jgi:hypothetical protein